MSDAQADNFNDPSHPAVLAAFNSPAPWIDRFIVSRNGGYIRIGVMEQHFNSPQIVLPRGAAAMTVGTARALMNALGEVISQHDAEVAARSEASS